MMIGTVIREEMVLSTKAEEVSLSNSLNSEATIAATEEQGKQTIKTAFTISSEDKLNN